MMKQKTAAGLLLLLLFSLTACGTGGKERFEIQYLDLFDTATTIIGYSQDRKEFDRQTEAIYSELKIRHQLYDIYNNYEGLNNIKTINDNAGIAPVKVDERILDLLVFGQEVYELTEGKTNIALGAVLAIWHTYREAGLADPAVAALPPEAVLQTAAKHTDISKMIIDRETGTVYLADPLMSLDVGAIAKGYAAEQAALLAEENGFTSALLNLGGNIRAIGAKANGEAWNVGIQNPDTENSETPYLHLAAIRGQSFVTSGDYIRYYTVNGKRIHHIIDPATLHPSVYFRSVTISCTDSGMADALSTALFCLPCEEGLRLLEGFPGTEAMWILPNGQERFSSGFQELLEN